MREQSLQERGALNWKHAEDQKRQRSLPMRESSVGFTGGIGLEMYPWRSQFRGQQKRRAGRSHATPEGRRQAHRAAVPGAGRPQDAEQRIINWSWVLTNKPNQLDLMEQTGRRYSEFLSRIKYHEYLTLLFCSADDGTQDLMHPSPVLYHWVTSPSPTKSN